MRDVSRPTGARSENRQLLFAETGVENSQVPFVFVSGFRSRGDDEAVVVPPSCAGFGLQT